MMGADFTLPCDVHLPPATVLRKGVTMSTLLTAMRQREGMDEGMTCFNRDAKRSDLDALARSAQDHGGEANEMIGEVERRRAATMGLVDGYAGIIRGLETRLAAAEARVATAVEVLRRPDVQWGATYHDEMGCPVCSGSSGSHMTGCELAAVISENPGSALGLEVVKEGRFLLERIRELGSDAFTEDGYRDFAGHVAPSMARLATLLSDHPAPEPGVEAGEVGAAFCWAMDEIDRLSNRLCGFAYPQGMAMLGREDQHEAYVAAVHACRRAIQTPADGGRDG